MTTPPDDSLETALEKAEEIADIAVKEARQLPLVGAIKAVALGVRDTAKDMLQSGREEARRAHDEAWSHYDDLTKHRGDRKDS